jgi:hypothetical protein
VSARIDQRRRPSEKTATLVSIATFFVGDFTVTVKFPDGIVSGSLIKVNKTRRRMLIMRKVNNRDDVRESGDEGGKYSAMSEELVNESRKVLRSGRVNKVRVEKFGVFWVVVVNTSVANEVGDSDGLNSGGGGSGGGGSGGGGSGGSGGGIIVCGSGSGSVRRSMRSRRMSRVSRA